MKILYVEDNQQDADLTRRELGKSASHIQLDLATTLDEARRRFTKAAGYDLVLLDLRLPDGSGLELLGEIQEQAIPVVVVILTGSGDEETAVAALKAGAHDYIVKRADYLERLPGLLEATLARFRDEVSRHTQALRVIYVERNSADIDLTHRHLARYAPHIRLEVMHSIEEVLQRLPTAPEDPYLCDILLLDYQLPGLNALEALKIIRHERRLDLPVVLVTGQGNEEIATSALRLGASDYLVKHTRYLFELPAALENAFHRTQMARKQAALAESEARFRRLAENALDVIFRVGFGRAAQIEYISPAVTALTGYTPEEFYANPGIPLKIIHEEDLAMLTALTIDPVDHEPFIAIRLTHQDGCLIWVEINPVFVKDGNGRVIALEGVARDITAAKKAEDELRLQSAALNAAANAILIIDRELKIQWANSAFTTLTGYTVEEAIGYDPCELVKSDMHDEAFYENLRDTILAGGVWHGEIINRRKDGSLYTEYMTITPLRDEQGTITHFIEIKQDISARKATEADRARLLTQVREQAQRMQQIVETVPEGVLLLDGDGRIVLANPVAERDLAILVQMDEHEAIISLGKRPLADLLIAPPIGQWHEIEVDGRFFEMIARPVGDHPQPEYWVMVINDVTETRVRQRYQQAQERLATVGQLAAGIAHDFNNVMAVIVLYAQILQKATDLSPKSRQHLAMIDGQAQHAAKLIQQILDFSRRSTMKLLPLNLLPLVKELVKLLERTLHKNIVLSLAIEQKDFVVQADPTRLQQALMNLAFNARDAMPDGGRLSFALSYLSIKPEDTLPLPDMTAGEWVQLDVSDTGVGIASDLFPRLFEPFFTTKERGKGTGLGLAQVHGIVKQHGGSIDVNSKIGEGTVFTIYLPRLNSAHIEPRPSLPDVTALSGMETILLVEDNEAMRLSVTDTLTGLGYRTLVAANGKEALAILARETAVSLLLTDLVMPEMSGLDLCRSVHKLYPHIKTLLMTGYPLEPDTAVLRKDGITGWIEKPFSIEVLAVKMRDILDKPDSSAKMEKG